MLRGNTTLSILTGPKHYQKQKRWPAKCAKKTKIEWQFLTKNHAGSGIKGAKVQSGYMLENRSNLSDVRYELKQVRNLASELPHDPQCYGVPPEVIDKAFQLIDDLLIDALFAASYRAQDIIKDIKQAQIDHGKSCK